MARGDREDKIKIVSKQIVDSGQRLRLGNNLPMSETEIQGLSPQSLQDLISRLGGLVT